MSKYTIAEANQVTTMMRDLATLKENHPILIREVEQATNNLIYIRDFIAEMLEKQNEDTPS